VPVCLTRTCCRPGPNRFGRREICSTPWFRAGLSRAWQQKRKPLGGVAQQQQRKKWSRHPASSLLPTAAFVVPMPGSRATVELELFGAASRVRATAVGPLDSWPRWLCPAWRPAAAAHPRALRVNEAPRPKNDAVHRRPRGCHPAPARAPAQHRLAGHARDHGAARRSRPLTSVWSRQPLAICRPPASRAAVLGLDSVTRRERRASGAAAAQTGGVMPTTLVLGRLRCHLLYFGRFVAKGRLP